MSKPLYGERFEYSVVKKNLTTELTLLLTKTFSFDLNHEWGEVNSVKYKKHRDRNTVLFAVCAYT